MAKISVIVPVYKVEAYLNRCVDSILNQTFEDFELILVDDGSPDRCGAICDEYAKKDSRIHVIHQDNGGLSAARNTGLDWAFKNSKSKWISFVDSDDWVHEKYLEVLYKAATENRVLVSKCKYQKLEDEIKAEYSSNFNITIKPTEEAYKMGEKYLVNNACWKFLYSKPLFKDIRFPVNKLWEDVYIVHKVIFKTDKVAEIDSELYYYFQRPDSIINRNKGSNWSPEKLDRVYAYENQVEFFKHSPYTELYHRLVNRYLQVINSDLRDMFDSSVSQKEKKIYIKIFLKKLFLCLCNNRPYDHILIKKIIKTLIIIHIPKPIFPTIKKIYKTFFKKKRW